MLTLDMLKHTAPITPASESGNNRKILDLDSVRLDTDGNAYGHRLIIHKTNIEFATVNVSVNH